MRAITHRLWPGYSWKKQVKVSDLLISSSGKIISQDFYMSLVIATKPEDAGEKGSSLYSKCIITG